MTNKTRARRPAALKGVKVDSRDHLISIRFYAVS
jgi:hypothetical protein